MSELSLEAFVGKCSLHSIAQFELSARREISPIKPEDSESVEPEYGLDIDLRDSDDGFRVRLKTRLDTSAGSIVSEVGAEYLVDSTSVREIPRPLLIAFVNNVAMMHILPYTRQSISDITARVFDSALLMPIIQRGELSFSEDAG